MTISCKNIDCIHNIFKKCWSGGIKVDKFGTCLSASSCSSKADESSDSE